MKFRDVEKYINSRLSWVNGAPEVDLDEYYKIVDDFSSMLINNPPPELRTPFHNQNLSTPKEQPHE